MAITDFNKTEMLAELKGQFFLSKYSTLDQFVRFSGMWPSTIDHKPYIYSWSKEKTTFLEDKLDQDEGIATTYQANLTERVAITNQIIDLLQRTLESMIEVDVKEISTITQTLQRISELQDKTMTMLKIEAVKENRFNKNKTSILSALREEKATPKIRKGL